MLTCPLCKKTLPGLEKRCRSCQTDVSLLVDYVQQLHDGLSRADALTRAGELGEAVWAYLEVLEVDPDNLTARRQVGQVVAAVRQFDRAAHGRRWRKKLEDQARFRRLWASWKAEDRTPGWLSGVVWSVLLLIALLVGYTVGHYEATHPPHTEVPGTERGTEPSSKDTSPEK